MPSCPKCSKNYSALESNDIIFCTNPKCKGFLPKNQNEGNRLGPDPSGFGLFWSKLGSCLKNKQIINNWTADKGFTGEKFAAGPTYANFIIVYPLSALDKLNVPKRDFELIYDNWQMYSKRKVDEVTWSSKADLQNTP